MAWRDPAEHQRDSGGHATGAHLAGIRCVSCPAAKGFEGGRPYAVREGQRTVMTVESCSACQEWSMPGPQMT